MSASYLPLLNSSLPLPHSTTRNVFVTQSEDSRKDGIVNHISLKTSSRALEGGVNTLQKTLILNKQADLDEVDKRLALKRQEFKSCVEILNHRRSQLEEKHKQTKERVAKFEKFVAENEAKRRRALQRCEATREENAVKQREIEDLTERLKQLGARKQVLKRRMEKYKIYEDYFLKTLDFFPGNSLDSGSESLVMPVIRRHESLSVTRQELLQRLRRMEEQVEHGYTLLHSMKQQHSTEKRVARKELSELQSELETLRERNKQAEVNLQKEQGLSRERVEEEGRLLLAVSNLAEQCFLPGYGPLEDMSVVTMMDMVKEYILDKADTERRARRLMGAASAMTEKATRKASVKSPGSKTQMKSSSKVSRKSETLS
ncbi:uncharacterized protein CCDC197 [Salarias fasciatus]|uniref:uncharacterized protein CCDC197 n=1 Tax=Salarias fasciatus TaxID=181472 RepID=UPI001177008E|nr:uncharacterized protein CCDC197 [Salarias fasciatus]